MAGAAAAEPRLRPPGGPRMCHKAGGGGGEGAGPRGGVGGKGSTPGSMLGEGRGEERKSPGGGGGGREEGVEGHPASLRKGGTD